MCSKDNKNPLKKVIFAAINFSYTNSKNDYYMNGIKQLFVLSLLLGFLPIGCGGQRSDNTDNEAGSIDTTAQPEVTMAREYDYRIVARYPHATTSYTQGLEYVDGVMWEGTGQEGESHLQRVDLATGRVSVVASLDDSEFGEGITHHDGAIYQLTWESHKAYKYSEAGELLSTIAYQGEGWGISSDGENLYLSDGTATIRRIDPATFRTLGSICVSYNGRPLSLINELECVADRIWANVYTVDTIVEIDPRTGVVVGYVDLSPLRYMLEDNPEAEVLNGIAYNPTTGNLYVTGKDWNTLFEIEIIRN